TIGFGTKSTCRCTSLRSECSKTGRLTSFLPSITGSITAIRTKTSMSFFHLLTTFLAHVLAQTKQTLIACGNSSMAYEHRSSPVGGVAHWCFCVTHMQVH